MSYIQPIVRKLYIGVVFSDALKGLKTDSIGLILFGLVLLVAPSMAMTWTMFAMAANPSALVGLTFLQLIVNLVATTVFQVAAFKVVADRLDGGSTTYLWALRAGGGRIVPYLMISVVTSLAIGLGVILLIVPGIYLALMWAVVGPAAVLERRPLDGTLKRSAELTRGNRWMILGLFLLAALILGVLMLLGTFFARMSIGVWGELPGAMFQVVLDAITGIIFTAGGAALYHELVILKEGGSRAQVVDVFD